jgi:competence protein ComGB
MVKLRILEWYIDQKKTIVPKKKQAQFLLRLSTLLEEGYTFHTSVIMLLPHLVKKVNEASEQVERIMRNGEGVSAVLQVLGIPKAYLLPIEMAESHGRLNKAIITLYHHISVIERAKASFKRIMMYPMFLFSILALLFIAFRTYFLPNMKSLVASRPHAPTDHVLDWTTLLLHLPDFILGVCVSIMISYFILRKIVLRKPIQYQIYLLKKIPILSRWIKLTWTRGFAQETGTLLAGGLSLQETLIRLTTQTYQPYLKVMSLQVYDFILLGESVEKAVFMTDCFLKDFPTFIAHGEASGHLAKELLIYSDLLTEQIELDVTRNLAYIQPILFFVLAVCILAAYLSILLPVYGMIDFI